MKVFFFGAGASVDAGYPITSDLLQLMEREFKYSRIDDASSDWSIFDAFRTSSAGVFKEILHSHNIELMMSQFDLLEATLNETDSFLWKQLLESVSQGNNLKTKSLQKQMKSPARKILLKGLKAKTAICRLIDKFFSYKHYLDSQEDHANRKYLDRATNSMKEGDVVIGTNWDTLMERTLMEKGKWNPSDGYGYHFPIVSRINRQADEELKQHSLVKVLKLHGSIGWHRKSDDEQAYLRHRQYLQYFYLPGDPRELHDQNDPALGPDRNPIMLYPTYLKRIDDPIVQAIWEQASHALINADEIVFVGYSLPKADVAIRALLTPLRLKIQRKSVKVTIVNNSVKDINEWSEFLGPGINSITKRAADYFS